MDTRPLLHRFLALLFSPALREVSWPLETLVDPSEAFLVQNDLVIPTNVWEFASETEHFFQKSVQFIWIQFTPNQCTTVDSRPQGLSGTTRNQLASCLFRSKKWKIDHFLTHFWKDWFEGGSKTLIFCRHQLVFSEKKTPLMVLMLDAHKALNPLLLKSTESMKKKLFTEAK